MASTSLRRSSRLVSAACTASTSGLSTTVVRAATVKDESQAITDKPPKRVRKKAGSTTEVKSGTAEAVNEVEESRTKSVKRKKKIEAVEPMPEDFAPRALNEWKIGPHVSSAGGVENSIVNAATIGANAFALFLKSQRKWESSPFSAQSVLSFKERMKAFGYSPDHILPHGSYLVNLGNPDEDKREKSYRCFLDDLKRCEELGLHLYNFHPGSTVGQASTEDSLSLVAACVNRAHKETANVVIVLENMAGSGNVLGSSFAELGSVIRQVEDKSRVGVCLDTCHMFAAGYDIRTKEGWE
ncbi:xylose isomerase-like protein [Sparassis latifolia]